MNRPAVTWKQTELGVAVSLMRWNLPGGDHVGHGDVGPLHLTILHKRMQYRAHNADIQLLATFECLSRTLSLQGSQPHSSHHIQVLLTIVTSLQVCAIIYFFK